MQTPPSIEDRNSTVAETGGKRDSGAENKTLPELTVQTKFKMNSGTFLRQRGLRLFNNPRAFYQHKPDPGTVADEQFGRTSARGRFYSSEPFDGLLRDHILGLTRQIATLLTHSDKQ